MDLDTLSSHHPNPLPNPHHRKIELQSPLDLTYLQNNLLTSAQQKLDLHFPPSALRRPVVARPATVISLDGPQQRAVDSTGSRTQIQTQQEQRNEEQEEEDDPMRQRVKLLVHSFLARTWAAAALNVSVNGLDATAAEFVNPSYGTGPPSLSGIHAQTGVGGVGGGVGEREGIDFTYAPYDARLQAQVAALYGEVESLTAQVARLRRKAPGRGAEAFGERLGGIMRRDDEEEQQKQQKESKRDADAKLVLELEKMRAGYVDDAKETYERAVLELARLTGVQRKEVGGDHNPNPPAAGSSASAGTAEPGGSLTETVGKVQRARTVAMEFE